MLTSAVQHWLRIYFRKVLTSLLWEMKKAIKTLIIFFSFSIKTFFNQILNQCRTALINISLLYINRSFFSLLFNLRLHLHVYTNILSDYLVQTSRMIIPKRLYQKHNNVYNFFTYLLICLIMIRIIYFNIVDKLY